MDRAVFDFIHSFVGQYFWLDVLMIFLAQYLPYILTIFFLYLLFLSFKEDQEKWLKRIYFFFLASLSLLIARGLIVPLFRFFLPRSRPFLALGFDPLLQGFFSAASFPSGHAAVFFVLASVAFFINRRWFWYLLVGAILNAAARVYVGVHWPSDVLVGAVVGAIVTVFLHRFLTQVKL